MNAPVPRRVEDITAGWMSEALCAHVTDVKVNEALGGTATKLLLNVTYKGASSLPQRMCLKAGMGEHAPFMAQVGIYATEARFFRDERRHSKVRAPQVYWAEVDDEFGAVLMEDLSRPSVRFCSARVPLSAEEAASVLENVALLHAGRWNSEWLARADWLEDYTNPDSKARAYFSMLGPDTVAEFIDKPGRSDVIPAELRSPRRSLDLFWQFVATLGSGPRTMVHGDLHIGNVYFDDGQSGLCDWQVVGRGSPAFDVAYLLGSALTTEVRRKAERELLQHYLQALAGCGVPDPPALEEMWQLYRAHMAYGYFAWLTNPEAFQEADIITEALRRFSCAVTDLQTAGALGRSSKTITVTGSEVRR
jgi:aminoglycoside/choline kinase family phosphotransferase